MSEDVYAKPDLTKKVRFQGGEKEERTVDIYDNADSLRIYDNQWVEESTPPKLQDTTEGQHQITPVTVSSEKRNPFRAAAVFLGLLCLLLLAGIIGVGVQFIQDKTSWNEERNQLRVDNANLTSEKDQLQTSYNNLTSERDQLQTSNNNLTSERDQLQTSNNNLTQKINQLENEEEQLRATNYNLTKERDELQKQLIEKACCPDNWQKFGYSCYFISTQKKNWKDSRIDCENKGALLVIISSREEQTFIASLNKRAWIGLTDEEREGTWKWVDGTPLTTGYWYNNQPDNMGPPSEKEEDCVETVNTYPVLRQWNDIRCTADNIWICEKNIL